MNTSMALSFMNDPMLGLGTLVFTGYFLGYLAACFDLPRITGYLLAGVLLNPTFLSLVPKDALDHSGVLVDMLLCLITFEIGGALSWRAIRSLGKTILAITVMEAEMAFLAVIMGMSLVAVVVGPRFGIVGTPSILAFALLMGGLISPTDPAATIAVTHQYGAKGPVTSTILGVSALDDGFGIVNFGVALCCARAFLGHGGMSLLSVVFTPIRTIGLSLVLGCCFGWLLDRMSHPAMDAEGKGGLVVVLFGSLAACFGTASLLGADELLSTMIVGAWVVNKNPRANQIFDFLSSTMEEPVFLVFFCVSGMSLNMASLLHSLLFLPFVVLFRLVGKGLGVLMGGEWAGMPLRRCLSVIGGLIPLGGIVIGLALTLRKFPELASVADTLINVVIGSTLIHECLGPLAARWALRTSGELSDVSRGKG